MLQLFPDAMRRDPFPTWRQLRQQAPVFHFAPLDLYLLLDYAGVRRAMSDHQAFSNAVRPVTGRAPDWLVFSDPPRHTRLRALLSRAFTPRAIAALEPRVQALSRELLAEAGGEFDLVARYAEPLPTLVIGALIGVPAGERARLMRWSAAINGLSYSIEGGEAARARIEEHARVRAEMTDFLAAALEERRRAPADDLLTRLHEAELEGEPLKPDEILGFFELLLSAGTETTTNLIDNGVITFAEHPEQLARLRERPELLPTAIEEVLRFRSPAQLMFREARRDLELSGMIIPAGKLVLPVLGAANRDPQAFGDPDRFDIGRDPNPHVAFGHGIHFCIGAALARLEARVALTDLLLRADVEPLTREWAPREALHVLGPARLPVRLRPR